MKSDADKKLLIRIDERQKGMSRGIDDINNKLDCKVENDKNYQEMTDKVDNLWDSKNKMIGLVLASGIAGGGVSQILASLIKVIQAKF